MNDQTHTPFPAVVEGRIGEATVPTVNARDLHRVLGVGKDFSNWIKDRITAYEFRENTDYTVFAEIGGNPSGGRPSREYALTLDMAKELAMVERNEAGKRVRAYFIECERKLRERPAFDPSTVLESPAAMRTILLGYTEKVIALEAEKAEMLPKVEAHDRLIDAHGTFCRSTAAKMLGVPPQTLIRWMKTNGWTFRRDGNKDDLAYGSKINAGLLDHKVTTGLRADGTEWVSTQVRVTAKGLTVLARAFPPAVADAGGVSRRGLVAGIAAAALTAVGLGHPAPARASTMPDGLAMMNVGGRLLKVDTTRFDLGERDEAVALSHGGELVVTPATLATNSPWLGARFGLTPWQTPGPGDMQGCSAARAGVWIVGKVVG